MQTLKQARAPLLAWIAHKLSHLREAMRPQHCAMAMAVAVARSGNPSGV